MTAVGNTHGATAGRKRGHVALQQGELKAFLKPMDGVGGEGGYVRGRRPRKKIPPTGHAGDDYRKCVRSLDISLARGTY